MEKIKKNLLFRMIYILKYIKHCKQNHVLTDGPNNKRIRKFECRTAPILMDRVLIVYNTKKTTTTITEKVKPISNNTL